jgi:nucleoside-diphosphate-sugar epimerase
MRWVAPPFALRFRLGGGTVCVACLQSCSLDVLRWHRGLSLELLVMDGPRIVLAGATGNLGGRIAWALREQGASVRALVRRGTAQDKLERLQALGVAVANVELSSEPQVAEACSGASCVVSALQGLRDVIVELQTILLDAAVKAGVPRFIPSDYSIDFTKFPPGENRNLDLRRDFHQRLDKAPISATTIFNGAFADMLTGQMPLILFRLRRVLYWGDADQQMDFTTVDDTAAFTACAALDPSTPRFLRIAGNQLSARGLAEVASEVTGKNFRLFRAGSLGILGLLIRITQTLFPGEKQLYPAWQGMQYMRNMFDGRAKLEPLDNDRYPGIRWTTARDVLSARST